MRMGKAGRKYISLTPAIGLMGILLAVLICPVVGNEKAHAEDPCAGLTNCVSEHGITIHIGDVAPSGANVMTVSDAASTGLASQIERDEAYFYIPVTIDITGAGDYGVVAYVDSTDLTGSNGGKISGITTNKTISNMNNEWGARFTWGKNAPDNLISGETTAFEPLPTNNARRILAAHTNLGNAEKVDPLVNKAKHANLLVEVGVSGSKNLAAGNYSTTLNIAAYANPNDIGIFGINYMQDMTHNICVATTTPNNDASNVDVDGTHVGDKTYVPERTLVDKRDGKSYVVRKLADGECWMVQNLEFDIIETVGDYADNVSTAFSTSNVSKIYTLDGAGLTAANTDINGTLPATTIYKTQINTLSTKNLATAWMADGSDGFRSFNFSESTNNVANKYTLTASNLTLATRATFVDSSTCNNSTNTSYRDPIGASCETQRRGSLYSWTAATLGSGLSLDTDGQDAASSVCPKGWQLPTNKIDGLNGSDNTKSKSWGDLLNQYGFSYENYNGAPDNENLSYNQISELNYNRIRQWPLSISVIGYYAYADGNAKGLLTNAYSWSSTAYDDTSAYYLGTATSSMGTQYHDKRARGLSVRCVAR